MRYTKIIGTPVITGLYTMLLPILAFAIFGSSRHLVVGADSATAVIVAAALVSLAVPSSTRYVALTGLVALVAGGLLLLARLLRLGFLADFISRTVLVGFLTGVGIQVALGQVAGMLGVAKPEVSIPFGSGTAISFVATLGEVGQASGLTVLVSLAVIATLVLFERRIRAVPGGLPAIGLPAGITAGSAIGLVPAAGSMVLVILAQSAATSRAYAVRSR